MITLTNMIMDNNNETDQNFLENIKLNPHMWTSELVNYATQRGYYESLVYLCAADSSNGYYDLTFSVEFT